MTFVDFWLELMMIWAFLTGADVLDDVLDVLHMWMFLTGAGVLDDILDGLHMPWWSYF